MPAILPPPTIRGTSSPPTKRKSKVIEKRLAGVRAAQETEEFLMMMKNAVHGSTCVYCLTFHIVFCTKYRKKIFTTDNLRNEMKQIFTDIANERQIIIKTMEVMDDHVHMLISFHPKFAISDIVKKLKGSSAKIFNNRHRDIQREIYRNAGVLWSPGYYVGSLGDMSRKTVEDYIANQYK